MPVWGAVLGPSNVQKQSVQGLRGTEGCGRSSKQEMIRRGSQVYITDPFQRLGRKRDATRMTCDGKVEGKQDWCPVGPGKR